ILRKPVRNRRCCRPTRAAAHGCGRWRSWPPATSTRWATCACCSTWSANWASAKRSAAHGRSTGSPPASPHWKPCWPATRPPAATATAIRRGWPMPAWCRSCTTRGAGSCRWTTIPPSSASTPPATSWRRSASPRPRCSPTRLDGLLGPSSVSRRGPCGDIEQAPMTARAPAARRRARAAPPGVRCRPACGAARVAMHAPRAIRFAVARPAARRVAAAAQVGARWRGREGDGGHANTPMACARPWTVRATDATRAPVHCFAGALQRLVDSKGCASCRCRLRRHGWREVPCAVFPRHGGSMLHDIVPLALLCLPFAGGVLAWRLRRRQAATWLAIGVAALALALALAVRPWLVDGAVLRTVVPWLPSLGLDLVLRVDGLAWLFLLLICGIGLLVAVYARYYMPAEDPLGRFCGLLLAFMGAMVGVVTAGNVVQLAFFWELTSLLSFLLIGYWNQGASAREGARNALIVTAGGGLCLFAGVLLLGHIVGSYDLDVILAAGAAIRASALYTPMLVLVALGALTKSAQFPFHFWLPQAMSAPTPVSAFLHSATMVKAGVFLLLRLWPVLAGTEAWFWIIGGAGLASLLLGAAAAVFQQDLKAVLAYSTISHLGLITMLLGLGSALGAVAAIFHIVNHATFKASLFMAAGAVDHETGTRDLRRLGGLRRVMP